MNCQLRSIFPLTFLLCLVLAASATADPTGVWRWEHEENGETIKDVMHLRLAKDNSVTGTYKGRIGPLPITDGKYEDGRLLLTLPVDLNGQKLLVRFDAKLDEWEGQSQEFPWKANRNLTLADVVGEWQIAIELDDGQVLEPKLTLKKAGDTIEAKYDGIVQELPVKNLKVVNKDTLEFTIEGEFNGSNLTATYRGKPAGDEMSGKVEYDFGGQQGELDFKAKRKNG